MTDVLSASEMYIQATLFTLQLAVFAHMLPSVLRPDTRHAKFEPNTVNILNHAAVEMYHCFAVLSAMFQTGRSSLCHVKCITVLLYYLLCFKLDGPPSVTLNVSLFCCIICYVSNWTVLPLSR